MTTHWTSWSILVGILAGCGSAACGNQGNQPASNPTGDDTSGGGGGNGSSGGGAGGGSGGASSGATPGGGPGGASTGGSTGGSSGASSSSGAGASDAGGLPPPTPHMGDTCLKAGSADFSQKGPYTVTKTSVDLGSTGELPDAGPTTYAIFTPSPLEADCPHPVVAWGNGTGVTGSSTNTPAGACTGTTTLDCLSGTYDFYNVFAASYGIVVIASDNSNVGSGLYHKVAIDYMAKQNADPSSPFYKKLSTRVGTSGHSQGGIGATAGADLIGPNCQAEVCIAGGGSVQKTNAFICLTGSADQAEAACTATYQGAPGPAFLADWDGGDHFTTETLAGYVAGQEGTHQLMHLYAAWFRCFLADDQTACKLFQGGTPSGCGICKDPGWHVLASKNL
ncbi:MAG TPA: hypothetical protein VK762_34500 [Polyangiaceae bacterium]|jgi:hypothetical protein|nr:hypothetical protein [Polyangiaceae bacterium]